VVGERGLLLLNRFNGFAPLEIAHTKSATEAAFFMLGVLISSLVNLSFMMRPLGRAGQSLPMLACVMQDVGEYNFEGRTAG